MLFNIFTKVKEEITDFDQSGVYLVGEPTKTEMTNKNITRGTFGGYYFSQRELLESIDMACASKYKRGILDEEGQRKTFINIVNFYRDVMKMKIRINVSNYIFEPTSLDYTWPVWLMDRKFKQWAEEESYDDQLNDYAHDLATYGSCVSKELDDCTERVPLRTMRNTQTARTLQDGVDNGGYVILENEFHYNRMKKYPDWNISGLDTTKKYTVQERYGLVPEGLIKTYKDLKDFTYKMAEGEEMVLAQSIISPEAKGKTGTITGTILFMEKIDKLPFKECHTEQRDGRWIGRGEVEKQLENQLSRNLTANFRRRGLLWATKKVFQSDDDEVQKNLVMEVRDGEVIKVKNGSGVSQVNLQSQHLTDFKQDDDEWKENSQQSAFAFDVAVGASLPSQTPFRLGIILSQAVAGHFQLIQKTFSNFLKRSFFDQLIPIFKAEYSAAHTIQVGVSAGDISHLKEAIITYHTNVRIFNSYLTGRYIDPQTLRSQVENEIARNPYIFIDVPDDFYKDINAFMKLNLVDDISGDISSLTTLYQVMSQKGDPRAEVVLQEIFAKQGKSLAALIGPAQAPQPAPQSPAQPSSGQPSPLAPGTLNNAPAIPGSVPNQPQ